MLKVLFNSATSNLKVLSALLFALCITLAASRHVAFFFQRAVVWDDMAVYRANSYLVAFPNHPLSKKVLEDQATDPASNRYLFRTSSGFAHPLPILVTQLVDRGRVMFNNQGPILAFFISNV